MSNIQRQSDNLEHVLVDENGYFDTGYIDSINLLLKDNDISKVVGFEGDIEVEWVIDDKDIQWLPAKVVGYSGEKTTLEDEETGESISVPTFKVVFDDDDFESIVYIMDSHNLFNMTSNFELKWRKVGSTYDGQEMENDECLEALSQKIDEIEDVLHRQDCARIPGGCLFFDLSNFSDLPSVKQHIHQEMVNILEEQLKPRKELYDSLPTHVQVEIGRHIIAVTNKYVDKTSQYLFNQWNNGNRKCIPDKVLCEIYKEVLDEVE